MNNRSYVIISPCRDEAAFLMKTIESVVKQSIQPSLWVIVDDGSTDDTPALLAQVAEQYNFIRVIQREDRGRRSVGPGVIHAFEAGLKSIDLTEYEYLCKLDLDLILPSQYFETLISRMEANDRLGCFSGKPYFIASDGTQVSEGIGDDVSVGASKFYRVSCFEQVGGFVREVMWDGIDCHRCRMLGWIVCSSDDPALRFIHLRPMGASDKGIWTGRVRWGYGQYFMGTGFIWILFSALYRMTRPPLVLGGIGILWGYIKSAAMREPRYPDKTFRRFLRRFHWQCLLRGKSEAVRRLHGEPRPMRRVLWPAKVLVVVTSLLGALLAAELTVRAFIPVRNVGPAFTIYDSHYGKVLKKEFQCQRITPEFTMRFSTNSLGFRGPQPSTLPTRGVLCIGDSFTMGYGVSDGMEFPRLIEHGLNDHGIPVINAGIGNTGNGRWVKFLRDQAAIYEPRLVVLQVTGNDFSDNPREKLFAVSDQKQLVELPVRPPGFKRDVQWVIEATPGVANSYLLGLVRQAMLVKPQGRASNTVDAVGSDDDDALTWALLERSISLCAKQDWPAIMISVDMDPQHLDRLRALCASSGIVLIEAPTRQQRPDLYYKRDGHWNPAGHAYVARLVLDHCHRHLILRAEPDRIVARSANGS